MIEKDFVPNDIAMEMFELGFNEKCIKFKWNDLDKTKWMGATNRPTSFHTQKLWSENDDSYTISIPTFSQCFRWFREEYGLEVMFVPDAFNLPEKKLREYKIISYDKKWVLEECVDQNHFFRKGCFKTYEDAEKACLEKLIEILKQEIKNGRTNL